MTGTFHIKFHEMVKNLIGKVFSEEVNRKPLGGIGEEVGDGLIG